MMAAAKQISRIQANEGPVLHLSGPILGNALESLVSGCQAAGGIERFAEAVELRFRLFQEVLGSKAGIAGLDREAFEELCDFMATVRRRVASGIDAVGFQSFRSAIAALLDNAGDTATADARMQAFIGAFPTDKSFRWVRDLGAEILHGVLPEQYPLMTKWVWDAQANTGVLREIWHDADVDRLRIDIPDNYATYLKLREELSQYLADNGVFRDMLAYVDLLKAQIYAGYINSQGGVYLRTEFASEGDPLEHVRRILGLDGGARQASRRRARTIDAEAGSADDMKQLS